VLEPYQDHVRELRSPSAVGERAANLRSIEQERVTGFHRVGFYLLAFAAAALLAWALSWTQGWVLAWISERISADLRNHHLCPLAGAVAGLLRHQAHWRSGGPYQQRHRSHLQLPLGYLVDFIADVLMIVGTAVVLLSIDPSWLPPRCAPSRSSRG